MRGGWGRGRGRARVPAPLAPVLLLGWPGQRPSDATDDSWWETRSSPTGELLEEKGLKKQRQIHFCKKDNALGESMEKHLRSASSPEHGPRAGSSPEPEQRRPC